MMTLEAEHNNTNKVPILLLKTKSSPTDAYEEVFSTPEDGLKFEPIFVPVLQHRFEDEGMRSVGALLSKKLIGNKPSCSYGGMIFTSQRAVEAFTKLIDNRKGSQIIHHLYICVLFY
jgi:uroporphyrinogen-III synthase